MVGTFMQRNGSITSAATDFHTVYRTVPTFDSDRTSTGAPAMTQVPEMPKLKPCPFCGGVAVIREDTSHSTGVFFGCNTSGCLGAEMWEESASEAISAWNSRADLPPTPAEAMLCPEVATLVEAMRNAIEAIDAAYDGPDDNGRYSTRERSALAAMEQGARRE